MNELDPIGERLLCRIEKMWARAEETGEVRWIAAAVEADRLYRVHMGLAR